jgi:hypothetical protein
MRTSPYDSGWGSSIYRYKRCDAAPRDEDVDGAEEDDAKEMMMLGKV